MCCIVCSLLWHVSSKFCFVANSQKTSHCTSTGQPVPGDIIVARDRSGHFRNVQAAVNSAPDNSTVPVRIYIRRGKYFEKILVPRTKTNIHFIGESRANTILFYDDYAGRPLPGGGEIGTGTSYSAEIQGNDFYATNIRFQMVQ